MLCRPACSGKTERIFACKNQLAGKMLKFAVSTLMILIMFRMYGSQWGIQHFEFVLNGLLPVVIIYWAYEFVIELPVIRQILEFLGKHSADIFYTHTFVRSLWIPGIVYSFRHAAVIFLFLLGVSLGISFSWTFSENCFITISLPEDLRTDLCCGRTAL